jgi:hypothetical protein
MKPGGSSSIRHVGLLLVMAYALLFVAISVDIMVRVWDWRFRFETPLDVLAILYFESIRTLLTVAGVTIAGLAAWRSRRRPALLYLGLAVAFSTVAYTKAMGFGVFPGQVQEAVATALRERDTPEWLLMALFAHPQWALWLALPPLILFAAGYPRPLTPADVAGSGAAGREGAMRSVAVAGTDVARSAREATVSVMRQGLVRPAPLWALGFAAAAVHTAALHTGTAGSGARVNLVALAVLAAAGAVCLTLLRAGGRAASAAEAVPLSWLRRGALASMAMFVLAAISGVVLPGGAIAAGAFSLAPAAMAAGLFMAVVTVPGPPVLLLPPPAAPPAAAPSGGALREVEASASLAPEPGELPGDSHLSEAG